MIAQTTWYGLKFRVLPHFFTLFRSKNFGVVVEEVNCICVFVDFYSLQLNVDV